MNIQTLMRINTISENDLRAFLATDERENERLSYTQTLTDDIVETVAAMANTNGGIILIGVAEKRDGHTTAGRPGEVVGVPPGEPDRLINKCYSYLDPARFGPEVLAVPLENTDSVVVIARVNPQRVPVQPVIVRRDRVGKVFARYEDRDREADPVLLRHLFSRSAEDPRGKNYPGFAVGMEKYLAQNNIALVLQIAYLENSVDTGRFWSSEDRQGIQSWLKNSPFCRYVDGLLHTEKWVWRITDMRARSLHLEYDASRSERLPAKICARLEAAGMICLDLVFYDSDSGQPQTKLSTRYSEDGRLRWDEAYQVTLAALATVFHPELARRWPSPGWSPTIRVDIFAPAGGLDRRITKGNGWQRYSGVAREQDIWVRPLDSEVHGLGDLVTIAKSIWTGHLFNLGYADFESDLEGLKPDKAIREAFGPTEG